MKIWFQFTFSFLVALILDGLTKLWAEQTLILHKPVVVFGEYFRLTLGYNTGVAFGMFANGGQWPLIVTGLVILGLMIWLLTGLRNGDFPPIAVWPMGFLLGGATANFIDRFGDGRVTDFLDAGVGLIRWPTFNIADSFIVVALAVLMLFSLVPPPNEQTEEFVPNGQTSTH
jgi:signal peptidase II